MVIPRKISSKTIRTDGGGAIRTVLPEDASVAGATSVPVAIKPPVAGKLLQVPGKIKRPLTQVNYVDINGSSQSPRKQTARRKHLNCLTRGNRVSGEINAAENSQNDRENKLHTAHLAERSVAGPSAGYQNTLSEHGPH